MKANNDTNKEDIAAIQTNYYDNSNNVEKL
jgi:hypothetical protein